MPYPDYYDRKNVNSPPPRGGGDVIFWLVTALFFFAGAWPLALIMLAVKLGRDKKLDDAYARVASRRTSAGTSGRAATPAYARRRARDTVLHRPKKGARVLTVLGIIGVVIGALVVGSTLQEGISWGWWSYLTDQLMTGIGFLACGGCLWGAGRGMRRREMRRLQYMAAIKDQRIVRVETLASIAGVSRRKVWRDLEDMIEDGLLPADAFLDRANGCLVLDAAAMPYHGEAEAAMQPAPQPAPAQPAPEPSQQAAEDEYQRILREIRSVNDHIRDEAMTARIARIEQITGSIFDIVRSKPERRQEIRGFFSYYLPTTQKLLDFYAQLEAQPVQSDTIRESRRNIEGIMDNLVRGFENQLDSLFRTDALDISSDIAVLENMLAKDGLGQGASDAITRAAAGVPSAAAQPAQPAGTPAAGGQAVAAMGGGAAAAAAAPPPPEG